MKILNPTNLIKIFIFDECELNDMIIDELNNIRTSDLDNIKSNYQTIKFNISPGYFSGSLTINGSRITKDMITKQIEKQIMQEYNHIGLIQESISNVAMNIVFQSITKDFNLDLINIKQNELFQEILNNDLNGLIDEIA